MNKLQSRDRKLRREAAAQAQTLPGAADPAVDQLDEELDEYATAEKAEQQLREEEARQAKLDALASVLSKKRLNAVEARASSNIEEIWREDEEFYEGIDAANRGEGVSIRSRDNGGSGAVVAPDGDKPTGTTVFLNITRAYVDFSAGRAADMLLPTDDRNWDLTETPMPDIIKAFDSVEPLPNPQPGMETYGQAALQIYGEAQAKVEKARTRIEDWMEEGQYSAEQRKILREAAKVGVAILKGPFPVKRMARAIVTDEQTGALKMVTQNKTAPQSKYISHWDFFPDGACGEDIQHGGYVWERDRLTARRLRDLKETKDSDGQPMYIESAIDQCLSEGPARRFRDDDAYQAPDNETYEIWYYYGTASAEDLAAAGVNVEAGSVLPVMITMVNDRVIKAALTTLDTGDFPYDCMVWQERAGHWAGIGVARQVRDAQRMLNAGVRNLLDNAALGAGPQIVMAKGALTPMGKVKKYKLAPRKMWELDKESGFDDVNKAFAAITIPMVTDELMAIINFALKMAEDVTGMPMLLQGQQGQASKTVGGMQMLSNNSNTPLRAIAKVFDDRITIPHLMRYYEWLLMYGPDDAEKGEFVVAARGSSALFERDAQNQAIIQMAGLIGNPAFNINPEKWLIESLKAQRLAPERFMYTQAEKKQLAEQAKNNPPPADPRIEAANIAAQAGIKKEEIKAEVTKERIRVDTDRDTVYVQAEQERAANDHAARMMELQLKREIAMLELATQQRTTVENIKAQLAQTTMKLQTQERLAGADGKGPQVATPPTEPPGRAENGRAYQE